MHGSRARSRSSPSAAGGSAYQRQDRTDETVKNARNGWMFPGFPERRCVARQLGSAKLTMVMGVEATGFELRDHTADIALYAWGDSLEGLFGAAADGLYATIGEIEAPDANQDETLRIEGNDVNDLLHDFLAELLYRFETGRVRLSDFAFEKLGDTELVATAIVGQVDPEASIFDREVKAVTYHDLHVLHRDGRYEVTVILDI